MDKIILQQTILEQWHFLGLEAKKDIKSDLSLDITFWEDEKQKKPIIFQNSVFLDETSMTVFYWEKSKDKSKGLFGDGDIDVTTQSGKSLFRSVKHITVDESGNRKMIDLNLGDISMAVKNAAKDANWKYKVVLKESKAMYPNGNTSNSNSKIDTTLENHGEESKTIAHSKKKIGITFWIAWSLLLIISLIACIGMEANWIAYPIVIIIFGLSLVLRKYLLNGFVKGLLLLFGVLILVFIVLLFNLGDQSLNQDTQAIQEAFASQDIQVIETYIHPETKAELMPILTEHQSELTRISELMKTKKLIYSDDNYAEYEVTENNQSFTMVFEKVGDTWLLVRF